MPADCSVECKAGTEVGDKNKAIGEPRSDSMYLIVWLFLNQHVFGQAAVKQLK
jgi:hypothetical protein